MFFLLECFIHPLFITALFMSILLAGLLIRRANKEG